MSFLLICKATHDCLCIFGFRLGGRLRQNKSEVLGRAHSCGPANYTVHIAGMLFMVDAASRMLAFERKSVYRMNITCF